MAKGLFEKNLSILKSIDRDLWEEVRGLEVSKDLSLFPSRSGRPTLKVGKTLLHSAYDPIREAERWVSHHLNGWDGFSTPLIFGLGLGYHVMEMAKRLDRSFVVVEPDLRVFRRALEVVDLEPIVQKAGLLVSPSGDDLSILFKDIFHLMPYPPSATLYPEEYQRIERRLTLSERYRILVVGPVYGGSLPILGYVSSALKDLGYEVEVMDCSPFREAFLSIGDIIEEKGNVDKLRSIFTTFLSELIMARVVDFKPDLFFALAQAPVTVDLLERLKGYGIPRAFWFVEDFRLFEYWKDVAPLYDYFFTIQDGEFFGYLKDLRVKNFHYLPLAADPSVHRPLQLSKEELEEYGSDLSFVGVGYYNRRYLLPHLIDFDLKIWGSGWGGLKPLQPFIQREGRWISPEEYVKVFNASRINLNLHSSTVHQGVNPYGDFVNPRTFEIASCGAFQLVDRRSHLPRFFNEEEMVTYESLEDLREKIKYYLKNGRERKEMARRARERVVRDHTYRRRMEEAMAFMVERGFCGVDSLPRRYLVRDLVKKAGPETELGRYLLRFLPRRSIEMEDIVRDIREGAGSLTRPETIFLIMKEMMERGV